MRKSSKGQIAYVRMFPERTDLQIPLIQTCLAVCKESLAAMANFIVCIILHKSSNVLFESLL